MKISSFAMPACAALLLSSCGLFDAKEDALSVRVNGTHRDYTDGLFSDSFYWNEETGKEEFEFWCYTENGDVDHDFFVFRGICTSVGTHVVPCALDQVHYRTPAGELCECDTAYYTVTEYDTMDVSITDPFISFTGTFHFRMIEPVSGTVYEFSDGAFDIRQK